jgi:TetR/AcrR family transcriptional repressor of nem operon
MPRTRKGEGDTPTRILDVAERLLQRRGFNGFSYADVARELGLTKASLHYHFAGKAELGEALVGRYTGTFADALVAIDLRPADAPAKLRGYAQLYADVLRDERMCLCGMLAAEYETLPQAMRDSVVRFFDDNETWVQQVIEQGLREGTLRCEGSTGDAARAIVSGLEGAMLVARPFGDVARFQAIANRMIDDFVIEG